MPMHRESKVIILMLNHVWEKGGSPWAYVTFSGFVIFGGRFVAPMSKHIWKLHWFRKKRVPVCPLTFRASILNFKMATAENLLLKIILQINHNYSFKCHTIFILFYLNSYKGDKDSLEAN